jgi:hypothetical protein
MMLRPVARGRKLNDLSSNVPQCGRGELALLGWFSRAPAHYFTATSRRWLQFVQFSSCKYFGDGFAAVPTDVRKVCDFPAGSTSFLPGYARRFGVTDGRSPEITTRASDQAEPDRTSRRRSRSWSPSIFYSNQFGGGNMKRRLFVLFWFCVCTTVIAAQPDTSARLTIKSAVLGEERVAFGLSTDG